MRVALIGFACSGKTTVGSLLAASLNLPFCDLDALVEQRTAKSIADIFASGGEPAFRQAEADALSAAPQNAVVSCGGGTVLCDGFASFAEQSTVVWLRVGAQAVFARLGNVRRPLFDGLTERQLTQCVERRNRVYAQYADVVVDVDNLTPEQVAELVRSLLQM